LTIDGVDVRRVFEPGSTAELAEMIGAAKGPLAPFGSGTRLSFGNPLGAVDAAVDTRRLDRITEYVPADMTVHVEAGVRLGQLQDTLREQNQMLPLDPWCGREATVGGIIATNSQGPFRAVGTIRDWILGMRVVHADGRTSRTGGRVVKNVTGYDLAKLYTGSLGSLGVIAEVSLKVRARYDGTASARIRLPDFASAADMIRALRAAPLDPVSLIWTGPMNEIRIRFGEHASAVRWQVGQLPEGDWETFDSESEPDLWDDARAFYDRLPEPVVRVVARPSQVPDVVSRFRPAAWMAHAGNGILLMSSTPEQIPALRREFPVVLERASLGVRTTIPTFGMRGVGYETMRRLKAALDPEGRINPGRHVDGETGE